MMPGNNLKLSMITAILLSLVSGVSKAESIIVQSTTSTANSGLYDYLLPVFTKESGIEVRIVAVGTGQAIKNAKNCDGDVLLVHARASEQKFVEAGYGIERFDLMYNDFVFVGPPSDPAKIANGKSAVEALKKIAGSKAAFASRSDNSGTHKKEMALWRAANLTPQSASGSWYRETGSGMGATLNVAVGMGAYAMTDRATWISFNNKQDYGIQVEGDSSLFNQYGVIMVNPAKCATVKVEASRRFIDWLLSKQGQASIAAYHLHGKQLFYPNAH